MNNLKKVLALGLALVMLLGMFTIASAAEDKMVATDLADWDTVAHKDAVSLMVDLGIINGIESEGKVTFQPEGNIDRASWAKMVFYAANGNDDADAYLGTAASLTDVAGNWAESYINYLFANKYISGDGAGKYNPSNNVTVAEACKMMLTVLGYDAEDRQYQNSAAWAGNIMVDAKRNGLMDNVDASQTALTPLTRENAAEIVVNTLNANTVIAQNGRDNGEKYVMSYTKDSTLGYNVFGMVKVTATVSAIDVNGFATFSNMVFPDPTRVNSNGQRINLISTSSLNGKVKATANLVGEDVDVYVKTIGATWNDKGEITSTGNFDKQVVSSSAAKTNSVATKVITSGITRWNDLTTRGTNNYVATEFAADCAYYLNGESGKTLTEIQNAAIRRGTVVEFYTNADGQIGVVKAYQYTVDQVENGDAASKTLSDGTVQVRVPGVVNQWTDADKISGWQGLVDGDVVLVYRTLLGGSTYSYTIEKAEKITGKVTSFNSNGVLTINGASYRGSEQPQSGAIGDVAFQAYDASGTHTNDAQGVFGSWTNNYTLTDEYDFYLDKNGSIVAGIQLTESFDNSKVCLVLQAEGYEKQLGNAGSLSAELLFADGTTDIVSISKVGVKVGNRVTMKSVVDKVPTADNADRQIYTEDALNLVLGDGVLTQFFSYRETTAGYELTAMNDTNDARNWENPVTLGDGSAKVATVLQDGFFAKTVGTSTTGNDHNLPGWSVSANGSTKFIVGKYNANTDTTTYSVYESYRNVPTMDATMMTAICANTDPANTDKVNTVAKFVYLQTGAFKDDVPDGYVFIRNSETRIDPELADDDVYLVNIVDVDGQLTEMRVTSALADAIRNDPTTLNKSRDYVGKFFAIGEIDENGVVSSLTDGTEAAAEAAVAVDTMVDIGDEVITLAGNSYTYDDATVFVYVDMGWTDGVDANNTLNVREDALDDVDFKDAGTFTPNGFFNETDVNGTTAETGATYKTVDAVVICPAASNTADYVYVVRDQW